MTSRLARLSSSHPRLRRPRSVSCSASDNYRRPSGTSSSGGSRRRRDASLFDNIEPGSSSNSSSAATIDTTPIDIEDTAPPSTSTPPPTTMGQQDNGDNEWAGWGPSTSTSAGTASNADPELGWANESWAQPARNIDNDNDDYTDSSRYTNRSSSASQSNDSKSKSAPRQAGSKDNDEYNKNNYGEAYAPAYEEGLEEPDIAVLTSDELDRALPVVPFSQQATYFSGSATENIQRWGASLAATVVLSKIALIAAGTLTWPLWWPWALAAKRNFGLRKSSGNGGLWRTQILDINISGRPKPKFGSDGGGDEGSAPKAKRSFFTTMRSTTLLIGDPGGAQTELVLPYDARHDRLMPGQPAEMIVLSSAPTFESFKAVPEVYLPFASLWVSEYPHVARNEFLELSLQIERERKEEEEGGNRGEWYDDNGAGRPPPSSFGGGNSIGREYY